MSIIYIDNNNLITLSDLTNCATGAVDTGASVTCTIKDQSGAAVSGQTWPLALVHSGAGTYKATLDADLSLIPDDVYMAHVDAVGSGGQVGHWELRVSARARKVT